MKRRRNRQVGVLTAIWLLRLSALSAEASAPRGGADSATSDGPRLPTRNEARSDGGDGRPWRRRRARDVGAIELDAGPATGRGDAPEPPIAGGKGGGRRMQSGLCSCSPTVFHLRLDFGKTCSTDDLGDNGGILSTICLLGEAGGLPAPDVPVPPTRSPAAAPAGGPESVYELAKGNEDFSTLVTAIEAASLEIVLDNPGSFTVFAPDNSAFADVSSDLLNKLLNPVWKPQLQDLLLYHALGTEVYSSDLIDGSKAPTLNFQEDEITINTGPARVNEVSIIGPADIEASNGVVHPVSSVLVPPSVTNTIAALVAGADEFTSLLAALSAAGLGTALDGTGPFTVFAPTDEAFGKLPQKTVQYLRDPANSDQLMNLLLYHVVPATNAVSFTLQDGPLETLSGTELTVQTDSSGITINDARVVDPDVIASNGIIHVIDQVLIPDDLVLPGGKPPSSPPGQSPSDSKVPTYSPTSSTLEPGETYGPTMDTPIPTYAPTEGPPDVQVPSNTIGKKKKKDKQEKESKKRAPTYMPTEQWPTYSPTPFEMEARASEAGAMRSFFAAQGLASPTAAGSPPSWSPTSSTYYPTVSTEQPTSAGHHANLRDHSHWGPHRGLVDATAAEEWASVPPNDEFFERFPEWRARQEEIYRLRSRGRSRPDGRRRRLQSTAPDAQYFDLEWSELPGNIKAAYSALGYNEEYWCYGGAAPASEGMSWADLSPVMQGAARALGYNKELWDGVMGVTEDEIMADGVTEDGGDSISIEDIGIGEAQEEGEGAPSQLVSAQFLEIDTSMNMNIINQDDQYINVTFPPNPDGGSVTDFTLSYTSVSATLDPALPLEDQADLLPGGVILILFARTSGGEVLRNRVFWTYTMGCELEDVTIQRGDEFGWTLFEKLEPAREEFCPASSLLTEAPTRRPTSITSMQPTTRQPTAPTKTASPSSIVFPTFAPTSEGQPTASSVPVPTPPTRRPTRQPTRQPAKPSRPTKRPSSGMSMDMESKDILDHFDLDSGRSKKKDHHDMRHSSSRSHRQKKKKPQKSRRTLEEDIVVETEVFGRRIQSKKTRKGARRKDEVIFLDGEPTR